MVFIWNNNTNEMFLYYLTNILKTGLQFQKIILVTNLTDTQEELASTLQNIINCLQVSPRGLMGKLLPVEEI